MGSFVKSLRDQLEKAAGQASPWGDINPFVMIGLTEAILDLGLTEDQIYSVIRSYGRQLAAQVHPDTQQVNVSPERQRQILEAFDVLDHRENFNRALTDFRTLKAEDRRERKILSQTVSVLRSQIASFETQHESLRQDRAQLEENLRAFELRKKQEPLLVPKLEEMLDVLRKESEYRDGLFSAERMQSAQWKKRFEHLADYLANLGAPETSAQSGKFAFEANWVAVVTLCWEVGFPNLSPLSEEGKVRPDFYKAAQSGGIKNKKQIAKLMALWNEALEKFGTPDKFDSRKLPLAFSLIKLSAGNPVALLFGHRAAAQGGRIIGSIPSSDPVPITRANLAHAMNQGSIMERLCPRLVPGGLLVSVVPDPQRKASWSLTRPALKFASKRIILAVG